MDSSFIGTYNKESKFRFLIDPRKDLKNVITMDDLETIIRHILKNVTILAVSESWRTIIAKVHYWIRKSIIREWLERCPFHDAIYFQYMSVDGEGDYTFVREK